MSPVIEGVQRVMSDATGIAAIDPAWALIWFAVVAVVLALAFWPKRGAVARIIGLLRLSERVHIEDALKHLYATDTGGTPATVESLAGALEIARGRAVRLAVRLTALRLAEMQGERLLLTDPGKSYALRIVRFHRLWERYLADRTGVHPIEWHDLAERREHTMSSAEADILAARMGDPRFDPHGDPIPTPGGEVPPPTGVTLNTLHPGDVATIVHLEDEPPEVYQHLVSEGLSTNMQVRVLDAPAGEIRFQGDGREHTLDRVQATNVTVQRIETPDEVAIEAGFPTLADVPPGGAATVRQLAPACQGPQRRRLLDLGVVPGTVIRAEFSAAGGDPVAYRIRGALVALRRHQAEWIQVELASGEGKVA